jgi:hypothetical protein
MITDQMKALKVLIGLYLGFPARRGRLIPQLYAFAAMPVWSPLFNLDSEVGFDLAKCLSLMPV